MNESKYTAISVLTEGKADQDQSLGGYTPPVAPVAMEKDNSSEVARTLEALPRRMLIILHSRFGKKAKWKGSPLWTFISDITAHGSTYSCDICHALGWNPHQDCALANLRNEDNRPELSPIIQDTETASATTANSPDNNRKMFEAGWNAGFQEALEPDRFPDQNRCEVRYREIFPSASKPESASVSALPAKSPDEGVGLHETEYLETFILGLIYLTTPSQIEPCK